MVIKVQGWTNSMRIVLKLEIVNNSEEILLIPPPYLTRLGVI